MTDRLNANKAIQGNIQKYTFDVNNIMPGALSDQDLTLITITALNLASSFNIQPSSPISEHLDGLTEFLMQQKKVVPLYYITNTTHENTKGTTIKLLNSVYQILTLASGFEQLEFKVNYILGFFIRCGVLEGKSEPINPKAIRVPKSWHEPQESLTSQTNTISVDFKKRD